MPFLPFSNILSLRKELEGTHAEILTWGCDGYNNSVKQWSETCDTEIVRTPLSYHERLRKTDNSRARRSE